MWLLVRVLVLHKIHCNVFYRICWSGGEVIRVMMIGVGVISREGGGAALTVP